MRSDHKIVHDYCKGIGIDIGCGEKNDKRFPDAIAIDGDFFCEPDIVMDGSYLCIKENSLDYVVSFHCLEHFKNPFEILKKWKVLLKTKGILGIAIPDITKNKRIIEGNHGLETFYKNNNKSSDKYASHLSMMTLEELKNMFTKLNLNILKSGDDVDPDWSVYCIGVKNDF